MTKAIAIEVRHAVATELGIPNEHIEVTDTADNIIWFNIGAASFTCKTVRNGSRLKTNSIRRA